MILLDVARMAKMVKLKRRGFSLIIILWVFNNISKAQALDSIYVGCTIELSVTGTLLEPVTNGAVSFVRTPKGSFVYVFGGIDSSLSKEGIHKRSYKINIDSKVVTRLPDLPDSVGKIASSATRIKDKIYIVGGYYVHSNGSETSSNKVHVFDAIGDTFLLDAAPIPIPIDDQAQFSYLDSLVYVLSGWSNGQNVNNVQVYDPENNNWFQADPIPSTYNYKAFGLSGSLGNHGSFVLIGGAQDRPNFPPYSLVLSGLINEKNSKSISWGRPLELPDPVPFYRGITFFCGWENQGYIFLGGSDLTYNYNAKSYLNGQLVHPPNRIYSYWVFEAKLYNMNENDYLNSKLSVPMDVRDWGKDEVGNLYTVGGIDSNASVNRSVIKYAKVDPSTSTEFLNSLEESVLIKPNPFTNSFKIECDGEMMFSIYSQYDMIFDNIIVNGSVELKLDSKPAGVYFLRNKETGKSYKIIKQ